MCDQMIHDIIKKLQTLDLQGFLAHFYEKFDFLKCRYSKIFTRYDTKTIVMEETNRQSLYVCSAALLSGIADLE